LQLSYSGPHEKRCTDVHMLISVSLKSVTLVSIVVAY